MTYPEILAAARDCVGPFCKACPVCNGKACGNVMPGPGSKAPGNGAARNYEKWQSVLVNVDTLCPNAPIDISFELFGHTFAAPIFAAPIGAMTMHYGEKHTDLSYNRLLTQSACENGILAFTGDGADAEILKSAVAGLSALNGLGIPTIKPWNEELALEKLDLLNENHIFAAAMDVDGAGLPFLKALNPNAGPKSVDDLRRIIDHAHMPMIIKGIMTPRGAEKAIQAGAAGIVVSNHGGRVQGGTPATAEVLPEIAAAVAGQVKIFVDGGIRTGVDVFRALALGADAVLIGRPIVPVLYGGGAEGFRVYLNKLTGELKDTMTMCGARSLAEISSAMVRIDR